MNKDTKPYRFLVIEDNPKDFMLLVHYLLKHISNPSIDQARSFEEAASCLQSSKRGKYDILFLDLTLPDKSGEELISSIVGLCSWCPVIVLTGYTDFVFSTKSLALGVSDYLLKEELTPFNLYKSVVYNIEHKHILSELEESESRYSKLFHFSPQPIWVYETDTYRFLDVNQAALDHYGYSRKEFLAMTVMDIRPPEDIPQLKAAAKNFQQKKTTFAGVFRHLKKNREIIQVEIYCNTIQYKGEDAKIVLAHDISENLKNIKAIRSQNQKLKEIAWIQSHVVRAPLARLMGLVKLLKIQKEKDQVQQEFFDMIMDSATELDDVIHEITRKSEQISLEE
ncbi:response regulator [Pontibacter sp. SGAir0037]|uniref:response regulator n=1 Tax=Pontibacter sp. SGAir0037 TaxID=2571030 RepID=UPI0010CD4978|nr:response regulator [Pontibacter sp. SGAir0037]QCR21602.1 histidine kinase [Pontibacter sp. SGAir0037]